VANVKPFGVPALAFRPDRAVITARVHEGLQRSEERGHVAAPNGHCGQQAGSPGLSPTLVFNMALRQVARPSSGRSPTTHGRWRCSTWRPTTAWSSFSAKYHYNFWRPENAIRYLSDYGNPKTPPDATYVPFISTPCFPSYPSNHASGSNGAAEILRRVYGEGGHTIKLTNPLSPAVANLEFDYSTFNEVCDDVDDARVFGGIHYRFDQVAGNRLGREIATYVYKHNLRKANGPK
jgi:hypothetical protein